MEDDKLFKEIAQLCKPKNYGTYQGYMYSLTEVKLICIDAFLYVMEHYGEEKIDINDFFKEKGL
jgi:hypothetical protein